MNIDAGLNGILAEMDYRMVNLFTVGEDPRTHCVRGYAIGEHLQSDGDERFAVWQVFDWTKHPNKSVRTRGLTINGMQKNLNFYDAKKIASNGVRRLEKERSWLVPGTAKMIERCCGA